MAWACATGSPGGGQREPAVRDPAGTTLGRPGRGDRRPRRRRPRRGDPLGPSPERRPGLAAVIADDGLRIGKAWVLVRNDGDEAQLEDPVPFNGRMPPRALDQVADGLRRRRRRSFTWCRNCGRQLAPERRFSRDLCYGCATFIEGVVY